MRRIVFLLSILAAVARVHSRRAPPTTARCSASPRTRRSASTEERRSPTSTSGRSSSPQGNKVAPIWAFTNGAAGQHNIIDTVPGRSDYTPLWAVRLVTWKDGQSARVLRSAVAVRRAAAAGQVSIKSCPSSSTARCCRQADELSLHLDEAVSGERRDGLVIELRSPARLCRDEPQRACAALAEGALVGRLACARARMSVRARGMRSQRAGVAARDASDADLSRRGPSAQAHTRGRARDRFVRALADVHVDGQHLRPEARLATASAV